MPATWRAAWHPHYVLDYENRFRESVIDNFADSYASGETRYLASNATARSSSRPAQDRARTRRRGARHRSLCRIAPHERRIACVFAPPTADRDQSYFLFATRASSSTICASLGDLTKPQTRELARRLV